MRVDAAGTPFVLEINPNCGVYYPPADAGSADLCLPHDPAGHAGFTRQLVRPRCAGTPVGLADPSPDRPCVSRAEPPARHPPAA